MTTPPTRQATTQTELDKIFADGGWAEKLRTLRELEVYNQPATFDSGKTAGTRTIICKYYDSNNLLQMVIAYYQAPGDSRATLTPIPRGVLHGGVWRYS